MVWVSPIDECLTCGSIQTARTRVRSTMTGTSTEINTLTYRQIDGRSSTGKLHASFNDCKSIDKCCKIIIHTNPYSIGLGKKRYVLFVLLPLNASFEEQYTPQHRLKSAKRCTGQGYVPKICTPRHQIIRVQ